MNRTSLLEKLQYNKDFSSIFPDITVSDNARVLIDKYLDSKNKLDLISHKILQHNTQPKVSLKKNFINYSLLDQYLQNYKLQDIPHEILKLPGFKNFSYCSLYTLNKGSSYADISESANTKKIFRKIASDEFLKIFTSIKKSKKKFFDHHYKYAPVFNIVGTFIATTYVTQNLQIIFLLSRNDFIAPLDQEISNAESFFKHQSTNLAALKNMETLTFKSSLLESLAKIFFEKIIISKNQETLFNFNNTDQTALLPFNENLSYYYQIKNDFKHDLFTDIHHKQRLKLIGELFNTLKHELSNPIFGIKLYCSVAIQKIPEKFKELVNQIIKNVDRCQSILNNLGSIYGEKSNLEKTKINSIIDQTYLICKSELKQIRFEINWNNLGETEIFTSSSQVIQILFNLIINSCYELKTYYAGQMALANVQLSLHEQNDFIFISVTDNGPGISPEKQLQIFQPFFTTKRTGTGLGLAISKKLSNQLGGDLIYQNTEPQHGASFSLSLPKQK
jgi:two-component system NtrC family sensor kinase